jgi:uncharacterized protein (DUF934 family)
MPLLDRTGEKQDAWRRLAAAELTAAARAIVPFSDLAAAAAAPHAALGVEIANTVRPDELEPWLGKLDLVAIAFPSFSDGRGFSIARMLRDGGFKGTIRAVGPLIADQFAYALACGIDEIELPEAVAQRQPAAHWLAAADAMQTSYQRGYAAPGASILERRRAAQRKGA